MTELQSQRASAFPGPTRSRPISSINKGQFVGLGCVVATAFGWGLNWPATKFVLAICPPLSARGVCGLAASITLLAIVRVRGEAIGVPKRLWGRLASLSVLNVSVWMGFTTASMLWLPAGQAATLAYTMPIWTTLLAWPLLADRPTWRQVTATVLGVDCGSDLGRGYRHGIGFRTATRLCPCSLRRLAVRARHDIIETATNSIATGYVNRVAGRDRQRSTADRWSVS